jgi:copper chaperone CopZ
MKSPRLLLSTFGFIISSLCAADKPQPVTRTFFVSGVECGSCVYMVQQAVSEAKGVSEVSVVQVIDNYANVTYDPKMVSEHQIAQAVRDAIPIHGMPYLATLKLRVPAYAKSASKVDALFARWKDWLEVERVDKAKGEFVLHFLPLKADAKKAGPQGWSLAQFTEAMKAPAPKGLGLEFTLEQEGL